MGLWSDGGEGPELYAGTVRQSFTEASSMKKVTLMVLLVLVLAGIPAFGQTPPYLQAKSALVPGRDEWRNW